MTTVMMTTVTITIITAMKVAVTRIEGEEEEEEGIFNVLVVTFPCGSNESREFGHA